GFAFAEISHVNAHGSSTPQNDINETNAIKRTFGDYAYRIPVTSIKSIVGHALAAANAIELVASIQSIVHQEVPPTLNLH
ncbi:beta-ketoacyl-[acyl-carrier-protein] synthase family protein, partial [Klebsiella pneumoniae]|nr:beta-ketoacyl-[acyl-carrier-protein] synthase family protein [Klebsiella pneumoniae]